MTRKAKPVVRIEEPTPDPTAAEDREEGTKPSVPPEDRKNAVKAALFFFGAIAFLVILKLVLGY